MGNEEGASMLAHYETDAAIRHLWKRRESPRVPTMRVTKERRDLKKPSVLGVLCRSTAQ